MSGDGVWWMMWTARASMLLYALAVVLLVMRRRQGIARATWVAGCILLWVHVGLAFAWVHGWSHARAVEETARQTDEVTGWRSGIGVYFNYAMMLVWAADALYWCVVGHARYSRRPVSVTMLVQGFLLFMAVNSTVVFGRGATRWVGAGVAAVIVLSVVWSYNSRHGRRGIE